MAGQPTEIPVAQSGTLFNCSGAGEHIESMADEDIPQFKSALMSAYDRIEQQFQHKSQLTGISTGFDKLDAVTSGLQPGELIVVAARPSLGKTALSLNIAFHIATKEQLPVVFFSLQTSKEQLVQRMICSAAAVNSRDVRLGQLHDADWHRITSAVNNLYQAPIFIEDSCGISRLEMCAKARRLTTEHGKLGLIVVDSLQVARYAGRSENSVPKYGEIMHDLKTMARELHVPVMALSQVSRSAERRKNKRPRFSDLPKCGSVESQADVVAFIYRPSYYSNRYDVNQVDPDAGIAEIIISKQRNGPTCTVRLGFQGECARFSNLAHELPQKVDDRKILRLVPAAMTGAEVAGENEEDGENDE